MNIEKVSFASSVDGLMIDGIVALPDAPVKGVIVMAHGVAEYKERYLEMMEILTGHGFACAMNDHRGYGKSIRSAEDYGYTYQAGSEGTSKDFSDFERLIARKFPGKKLFLYGHSMGSLVALNHLKHACTRFSGVVLSGLPVNTPAAAAGKGYLLLKKKLKGDRYRDEGAKKMMFGPYNAKFKSENIENAWLNSDKEAVKAYNDDPMCGKTLTVDGYLSLLNLLIGAYQAKDYRLINNLLPIDIFVGENDPCVGFEDGAGKSAAFINKLGFVKSELHVMKGMRHEIHNETDGAEVIHKIAEAFEKAL